MRRVVSCERHDTLDVPEEDRRPVGDCGRLPRREPPRRGRLQFDAVRGIEVGHDDVTGVVEADCGVCAREHPAWCSDAERFVAGDGLGVATDDHTGAGGDAALRVEGQAQRRACGGRAARDAGLPLEQGD